MQHPLAKYEELIYSIEKAKTVNEAIEKMAKADALRTYTRKIGMDIQGQNMFAEARMIAECRAGELLRGMEKAVGAAKKRGIQEEPRETLSDIGISKKESSQWQQMADIPVEEIRKYVQESSDDKKEATSAGARRIVTHEKQNKKVASIKAKESLPPTGKYDVIVIDPPWPIKKVELECRPNQVEQIDYPTMSLAEIAQLELPAEDDCHLWLWTTHKLLPKAFDICAGWGFKYTCTFVWHKPGGLGSLFGMPQLNCEFALYARKGNPIFVDLKAFKVCFQAPRGAHSEKPQEFYDVIKRVTAGRRLDMFNRREISGFSRWGNQSDG